MFPSKAFLFCFVFSTFDTVSFSLAVLSSMDFKAAFQIHLLHSAMSLTQGAVFQFSQKVEAFSLISFPPAVSVGTFDVVEK